MKQVILILGMSFLNLNAFGLSQTTSISRGAGQTGRATADAGDASYLNPASLMHLRNRLFILSQAPHIISVSLSENAPDTIMPGALAYIRKVTDKNGIELVEQDTRATLADQIWGPLVMGITPHYQQSRFSDEISFQQTNVDVGFLFTPNDSLGFGLVFHDAYRENLEIPEPLRLKNKVGIGAHYVIEKNMRFRMDVLSEENNRFHIPTYMVGYEGHANRWVATRVGYRNEQAQNIEYGSFGLGLDLAKFMCNYAFEVELKGEKEQRHSVDLVLGF